MSVKLSPLAGAGWQFFDSSGVPLAGGLLYTYLAGTTTPQTSYTSIVGDVANSNPIVLDSAGRLSNPVWLTEGTAYKFILKNSDDVQIWSFDNISGINDFTDVIVEINTKIAEVYANLADTTDNAKGDALIGFKQSNASGFLANAVASTVNIKLQDWKTPQDFGAKGDGTTDDTIALNNAFSSGYPIYIPDTNSFYMISSTVTIRSNILCEGTLKTTAGFTGTAVAFDGAQRCVIEGLKLNSTDLRTPGTIGIAASNYFMTLRDCTVAYGFNYGVVVSSFGVTLYNCQIMGNSTNLSAYAPSGTQEINALLVIGGTYDSATDYSCRIGDPRFPSTITGDNPQGSVINFIGVAFDIATSTFNRLTALNVTGCYWERATTGSCVELGDNGASVSLYNVTFQGNYFNDADFAIKCTSPVRSLKVINNHSRAITYSELYAIQVDFFPIYYVRGSAVGSYANQNSAVHTGFRSLPVADITFNGTTLDFEGLYDGVQNTQTKADTTRWYPYAKTGDGYVNYNPTRRYYTTPTTGVIGTLDLNTFTFANIADAVKFNGGDAVFDSIGAGSQYVQVVDYVGGTMRINGYAASPTACTIGQETLPLTAQNVRAAAAPTTGTWRVGDIVYNTAPASAGYIGWVCTAAGTPGTWVTFGLIS
jgi:hypothetical protein